MHIQSKFKCLGYPPFFKFRMASFSTGIWWTEQILNYICLIISNLFFIIITKKLNCNSKNNAKLYPLTMEISIYTVCIS